MDQCPFCKSTSYRSLKPVDDQMTFTRDRQCNRCECVWRPGCPKWAAWLAMIFGVGILLVGIIGFFTLATGDLGTTRATRRAPVILLGLAGLGAFVLFAGIRALLGQWGQMEILEEPRKKL